MSIKHVYINIRGCNGSGKTSLLRRLVAANTHHLIPTLQQRDPAGQPRGKPVMCTVLPELKVAILGDYTEAAAGCTTAGCDRISKQDDVKAVLRHLKTVPGVEIILFEGIIVSTIFSSWLEFGRESAEQVFVWAFLDTPLNVCLERIQVRNGGKPVKEDQVADKHRGIKRVEAKAGAEGQAVIDLHWERPDECLLNAIAAAGRTIHE